MPLMGPIDTGFLLVESREHPMHVGGLQLFRAADGDGAALARELVETMRAAPVATRWRMRPAVPISSLGHVRWHVDDRLDVEYHVRRSAVPSPGRLRELFELVSRWQSALLDRHRPLWEVHVVEGLADGRVAVYTKIHHSLVDGVSALRLLQRACSPDPEARDCLPPWSLSDGQRSPSHGAGRGPFGLDLSSALSGGLGAAGQLLGMAPAAARIALEASRSTGYTAPFRAPRTILNGRVGGARRFVAQSFDRERFNQVVRATDATFNDVVLAVCGGALRAYLSDLNELPISSLTAMVPVSLRRSKTTSGGNNLGAMIASLGTDRDDPMERLQAVTASTAAAKHTMRELSPLQVLALSAVNIAGLGLAGVPGYLSVGNPPFNVVISNVPGPRRQMYFNGAHLEGTYPASIPYDGMAINITLVTYDDHVDFGITAARTSTPSVQRLIRDLDDALSRLQEACG